MDQRTKTCELTVRLNSGETLTGTFHVPYGSSSIVRPADAIRNNESYFFLFSEATITHESQTRNLETVLIHRNSIVYIECPAKAFAVREAYSLIDLLNPPSVAAAGQGATTKGDGEVPD